MSGSPATSIGCARNRSPPYSAGSSPAPWIIVPQAPSSTRMRCCASRVISAATSRFVVATSSSVPKEGAELRGRSAARGLFRRLVTRSPSCRSNLSGSESLAAPAMKTTRNCGGIGAELAQTFSGSAPETRPSERSRRRRGRRPVTSEAWGSARTVSSAGTSRGQVSSGGGRRAFGRAGARARLPGVNRTR